jgi:hypothetical protein
MIEYLEDVAHKGLGERQAVRIHFSLAATVYCVPADLSEEEKDHVAEMARRDMGSAFAHCPLEYVKQRIVGGVRCPFNEGHVHVAHLMFFYSHLGAEQGLFFPLDANGRVELVRQYGEGTGDLWTGTGPFTKGYPEWAIGRFEPPAVGEDDDWA